MIFIYNNTDKEFKLRETKTKGKFPKVFTNISLEVAMNNKINKPIHKFLKLDNVNIDRKKIGSGENIVKDKKDTCVIYNDKNLDPSIRHCKFKGEDIIVLALNFTAKSVKTGSLQISPSDDITVMEVFINNPEDFLYIILAVKPNIKEFYIGFDNTKAKKEFYHIKKDKFKIDVNNVGDEIDNSIFIPAIKRKPLRPTSYLLVEQREYFDLVNTIKAFKCGFDKRAKYHIIKVKEKDLEDLTLLDTKVSKLIDDGVRAITYFTNDDIPKQEIYTRLNDKFRIIYTIKGDVLSIMKSN